MFTNKKEDYEYEQKISGMVVVSDSCPERSIIFSLRLQQQ
jgi:hypothetical protein